MSNTKTSSRIEFRILETDFSPVSEVNISNVDSLAYQVALLFTKKFIGMNLSIDEHEKEVRNALHSYNDTYLSGVLTDKRIVELTSSGLAAASQGKINVGKNVKDGMIILSVRTI